MKRNRFLIESGIIRIIDPIFSKDWWGSKIFNNCLKGHWNFKLIKKDQWPKELIVHHEKYDYKNKDWKLYKDNSLIIISNKVAIFDEKYYGTFSDYLIFDKPYIKNNNGCSVYLLNNICNLFIQKNKENKVVAICLNFEK